MTREAFIELVRDLAQRHPAINADAAAAHAANESAYGTSALAAKHMNLWGVKAAGAPTAYWRGESVELPTWEEVNGKPVQITARFRRYDSWEQAVGDYAELVRRVYPFAAAHAADACTFLAGLFIMGPARWATDSGALRKALLILEQHGLLQHRVGVVREVVLNGYSFAERVTLAAQLLIGGKRTPRGDWYAPLGAHRARWRVDEAGARIDVTRVK